MKDYLYTADKIRTASGRLLDIHSPDANDILIGDIAHALSHLCRFAGHTVGFYSVAQHSYLTSTLVDDEHKMAALLHDASEAYLVDIPRPLKKYIPEYIAIEKNLMSVIARKFGFEWPLHPHVKGADELMLTIEWDELMVCRKEYKRTLIPEGLRCEDPQTAKKRFLKEYELLRGNMDRLNVNEKLTVKNQK